MNATLIEHENALAPVIELLKENKLPHQDLRLKDSLFIQYQDHNGKMIGTGGLEFYQPYALLRSVAVASSNRGKSHGKEIVADLLLRARSTYVKEVYLLTETAHDFFISRGFKDISREQVPAEIKVSSEFSSVCPVSAACMVYRF